MLRRKMPPPETLNDCVLLHQMGFRFEIHNGKIVKIHKERRDKPWVARLLELLF